jgi:MFS family permease
MTPPPAQAGPARHVYPPERQGWYAVGVLALTTTFAMLDQGILSLLIEDIIADFRLTDTQASLLLGPAFAVAYLVVGVPLSPLIDRWVRKRLIAIAITVWSLATAACGLAASFTQLFYARMAVGAGEAINSPASYSLVADFFPRERLPRAIYTLQLGSVAGNGLSMLLGGVIIYVIGFMGSPTLPLIGELRPWQAVLIAVGLPGVLIAGLLLTIREPPRRVYRTPVSPVPWWGALQHMGMHVGVYGPLFLALTLGALDNGSRSWGAAFFARTHGRSAATYGMVGGLLAIGIMLLGLWLGARWVDRMQARGLVDAPYRVVVYTRALNIPFAVAMPLMPTPELAMACNAVAYLVLGLSGPMLNAVMLIITPSQVRGQVMALYLFIFTIVGQGLSPVVTGLTTDYISNDLGNSIMLLHLVFLPAALAVTLLGWKPYRRAVEQLITEDDE